jgi:hypothetical protein
VRDHPDASARLGHIDHELQWLDFGTFRERRQEIDCSSTDRPHHSHAISHDNDRGLDLGR